MDDHSTGTPTARGVRTRPVDFLAWCVVALAVHLLLLLGVALLPGADMQEHDPRAFHVQIDEPWTPLREAEEDTEEVHEQEVVAEEPVIRDEAIADHVATDNDLPYEESFGQSEGLSDAPFEGPANNSSIGIGIGGGAGGAFAGRGGARRGGGWQRPQPQGLRVHGGTSPFRTEGYDRIHDNAFRRTSEHDISTFSIDVDTASYANVRRFLTVQRQLPPKDAVRIEELINYFPYGYDAPGPEAQAPFRADVEVAACPWNARHRLARIALKGKVFDRSERPAANLVFLVDVSGSMSSPSKLGLVKASLKRLVRTLRAEDRVALVVYAGAAGLVLPSTPGTDKRTILSALSRLQSGGSTNGGAGIQLAYRVAAQHFIEGGVNRVILATDGDFNVGISDRGGLTRLIEKKAKTGVYLSILGFGMGNLKDGQMEELSNKGNGNYAYIDSSREAHKVLVEQASGTLVTIAKDVKIQIFFNPSRVAGYRLIGYENRILAKEDFNNDKKDAGEIGAGHAVTALYEIVPTGVRLPRAKVDPNPFVKDKRRRLAPRQASKALFRLRLRYKQPDGDVSTLMEQDVVDRGIKTMRDPEFRWAAAVAAFGMLLRDSPHKGKATWGRVLDLATPAIGLDHGGYRAEFVDLVQRARRLALNERGE